MMAFFPTATSVSSLLQAVGAGRDSAELRAVVHNLCNLWHDFLFGNGSGLHMCFLGFRQIARPVLHDGPCGPE